MSLSMLCSLLLSAQGGDAAVARVQAWAASLAPLRLVGATGHFLRQLWIARKASLIASDALVAAITVLVRALPYTLYPVLAWIVNELSGAPDSELYVPSYLFMLIL